MKISRYETRSSLRKLARRLAILTALAITIAPRSAWAHAYLVRSAPAAGSHIQGSPKLLQLWYTEEADPALSTVSITGPDGVRVAMGRLLADAGNPLLLTSALDSPLAPGLYTVEWHAIAKDDGHPSKGTFTFTVDGTGAATAAATAAATTAAAAATTGWTDSAVARDSVAAAQAAAQPRQVSISWTDVEAPGYIVARWLNFAGLLTVLGVVAFILLVLPRVARQSDAEQLYTLKLRVRRRATTLGVVAALVILVTAAWRLYAELGVVGGNVTATTLLHSFWGHVWLAQILLAALLCLTFAHARGERAGKSVSPAWPVTVLAVILISATPAFSGHAAAAVSHRGLSVAVDIVHVLAAGGWMGGLLVLVIASVPVAIAARGNTENSESLTLVARMVAAFSPLALSLATLVIVTGGISAWMHVGSFSGLFHTAYGTVLLVKLGFVVLVLAAGAHNWLRMRPELARQNGSSATIASFRRSAMTEVGFAAIVILVTAVLVAVQPPLH